MLAPPQRLHRQDLEDGHQHGRQAIGVVGRRGDRRRGDLGASRIRGTPASNSRVARRVLGETQCHLLLGLQLSPHQGQREGMDGSPQHQHQNAAVSRPVQR